MNETNETTYENKCSILAEAWVEFRDEENFSQFMSYGDLGLPLAYLIDNNIIKSTKEAQNLVEDVWELFLAILGTEDTGFDSLDELLDIADTE